MAKLDVKAFGLAFGIICGAGMFVLGILSMRLSWGTKIVDIISSVYLGYKSTFSGSLIGAVWGFVDGAIGGVLIAWLYNKFAK